MATMHVKGKAVAHKTTHPAGDAASASASRPTAAEMSQYVAEAVRRAIAHPAVLPRHEEVVETTARLRAYLLALLPAAEARVDGMTRGTPEWDHAQSVVGAARRELGRGPGPGLRSAVLHMQDLGRACHLLRGVLPEERCARCAYLKADRRAAERRGDPGAMRDAATRMGVHQREAHGS
ncbi:DUF6415 family natural product biosynthesis protein [Streptomyces sp. SCA3-4]|uniref:DUF6415 family natural product biosynthesis protein n=1 Tax=Streptomyces sichuanensis TaxID=2871810 RepID=UPI001CE309D9|nr:DUF6415 family natural product biosynthesis protein [Streptomyces sichuanensis]MCA6093919.1 DUF6415 family natural product biosynthesis protein [Streptomyces sichuanensis]